MAPVRYSVKAEECGFGWGCEAHCMVCGARNGLKLLRHLNQFICESEERCLIYQNDTTRTAHLIDRLTA